MKKILLIGIISGILTSCSFVTEKNNEKLIFHYNENFYNCSVYKLTDKLNTRGEKQCNKYNGIQKNDSVLNIYGSNLKQVLVFLYNIKSKQIIDTDDILPKYFLKINCKYISELNSSDIIIKKLLNHFSIQEKIKIKKQRVFSLEIVNMEKLKKIKIREKTKISIVKISDNKIKFINCSFSDIANYFNNNYQEYYRNLNNKNIDKYTFDIPLLSFIERRKLLLEKYGIALKEQNFDIPFYYYSLKLNK